MDELEAILCGDDFEILIDGEPRNGLSYTLYNSSFEEEYYREADFSAPQDEGMYILSVEASWGNEKAYNGYQYWFKLEVAPTTSQADTTPQSSSLSSSESKNAIREVNATTELIGIPDRVILMVNEVETVYEADSAEYQKTLEILNERMPDGFGEAASAFMWLDEDEDAIDWSLMAQDFDYVRLAYNNPQTVKINCMKKSYEDYAPEGRFQDITFPLTESNLSGSTELFILGMKFFGILDNSEGTMSKLLP